MQFSLTRVGYFFAIWLLAFSSVDGDESRESKPIEIDVDRFEAVTPEIKNAIQDWIIDLESTPLLAKRLAVVSTGEYFTGGKQRGVETVDAKRFATCWAMQDGGKKQRIIFSDENLLNPIVLDGTGGRFVQSTAHQLDQLILDDDVHEAAGLRVYPVQKKPRLTEQLKMSGVFFPISATMATASEMYRGTAFNPTAARVEIEHLTGFYKHGNKTFAEFYYQGSDRYVLHRLVIFEKGVPMQVEDRIATSVKKRFRIVSLLNPKPEDWQQLKRTRKEAVPNTRTLAKWGKIKPDLGVPIELISQTLSGQGAIEVRVNFVWLVNDEVDERIFDPSTVGRLAPLQLIE